MSSSVGAPDLVSAKGGLKDEQWKLVRKGLLPAFSAKNIRRAFPKAKNVGLHLVKVLMKRGAGTPVEMSNALMCVTIDSIGLFGFDVDFGAVESIATSDRNSLVDTIFKANAHTSRKIEDPAYTTLGWLLPSYVRGQSYVQAFQHRMMCMLQEVERRGPPAPDDSSLAAHLLGITDACGRPLSPAMKLAQISIMFWAGHDTTGNTMAWILFTISRDPEVEAKVVQELDGLGLLASPSNPDPRDITWEDLDRVPYLSRVIKETMRIYPAVATVTARINMTADTQLSNGIVVPRRTLMYIPVYGIHMNPDNYSDPEKFDPDRWIDPLAEYAQDNVLHPITARSSKLETDAPQAAVVAADAQAGSAHDGTKPLREELRASSLGEKSADTNGGTYANTNGETYANSSGAKNANSSGGRNASSNGEKDAAQHPPQSRQELEDTEDDDEHGLGHGARRFIPFSDGRRNCIGMPFAKMSYKVNLILLLSRFRFQLADRMGGPDAVHAQQAVSVTLQPGNGLWMHAIPRGSPS
eukprot:jgi/Botrbrau1/14095/Bobra.182_3s0040.2